MFMAVNPVVSYLSTRFAGYSVDPKNSRGARKLTQTSRIIRKKKKVIAIEIGRKLQLYVTFCFICPH
jgi:hypothetical protein